MQIDAVLWQKLRRAEPVVLFCVLYLPSYLAQSSTASPTLFNHVSWNIGYWVIAGSRIALVVFMILLRATTLPTGSFDADRSGPGASGSTASVLQRFGIGRLTVQDLLRGLGLAVIVTAAMTPVTWLAHVIAGTSTNELIRGAHWTFNRPWLAPLVLVTCLAAGYNEELFFRAYLLSALPEIGIRADAAAAGSVALFALGHVYEGPGGVVGAALIGALFSAAFLRGRRLNTIAVAHGLYNFGALLLTFVGAPGR